MTPEQRALHARAAAHARWARADRVDGARAARKAFADRFERQVDPDGERPPDERARRAANARKAYFTRLALASSRARAARRSS